MVRQQKIHLKQNSSKHFKSGSDIMLHLRLAGLALPWNSAAWSPSCLTTHTADEVWTEMYWTLPWWLLPKQPAHPINMVSGKTTFESCQSDYPNLAGVAGALWINQWEPESCEGLTLKILRNLTLEVVTTQLLLHILFTTPLLNYHASVYWQPNLKERVVLIFSLGLHSNLGMLLYLILTWKT